jgi:leader peptidase (prepilin peptidase)/N-methyltransferase
VGSLETALVAAAGLIVGRSLNAFIVRISQRLATEEHDAGGWVDYRGPAHYPGCRAERSGAGILPWQRCLPILSYWTLPLRCRACGAWRSPRYLLVDLTTAGLALAVYASATTTAELVVYAALTAALIVVTVVDLDFQLIPDTITFPGMALGLAAAALFDHIGLGEAVIGLAAGAGVVWAIGALWSWLRGIEAMGLGDVKLLGMIGTVIGWQGAMYTLFIGSVVGSIVGSAVILLRRQHLDTAIPFGPFLAAGAVLYMLSATRLLDWYLRS